MWKNKHPKWVLRIRLRTYLDGYSHEGPIKIIHQNLPAHEISEWIELIEKLNVVDLLAFLIMYLVMQCCYLVQIRFPAEISVRFMTQATTGGVNNSTSK